MICNKILSDLWLLVYMKPGNMAHIVKVLCTDYIMYKVGLTAEDIHTTH